MSHWPLDHDCGENGPMTLRASNGMVTSPHRLASRAGLRILQAGGTAAEAAVATAATLAVVYPHMNAVGGDSFWLLGAPGDAPVGIDASGRAAAKADLALYAGLDAVPWRGPLAANTVAGTISGWASTLEVGGSTLPLAELLAEAIRLAEEGFAASVGLSETVAAKAAELSPCLGFADVFMPGGEPPAVGQIVRQPALARTLRRLAADGLDGFYHGALAEDLAADLAAAGSPISLADLGGHRAETVTPLSIRIGGARLYNLPPPTQGVASLMILALVDRLACGEAEGFDHVHSLVEATKQAFRVRDAHVGDPGAWDAQSALDDAAELDRLAAAIDPAHAAPWPQPASGGDTVWFGVVDGLGRSVSAIQSTFFEFGSGLVLPRTGVTWQNRGSSFTLTAGGPRALRPGAKPFHTLNPAMAVFDDGRTLIYGTMGGEGQPQTQGAVFSRYARFGQDLQAAVDAPRWLLGRTWGDAATNLKLEDRFAPQVVAQLRAAGHDVELVAPMTSLMGHAGAIVRLPNGALQGAADPRSDGEAVGY
ncbi:MAG: ywrD [Caulobacteraceae bacterium]|nr:ywrD [Caulobacteraceae bacterium]